MLCAAAASRTKRQRARLCFNQRNDVLDGFCSCIRVTDERSVSHRAASKAKNQCLRCTAFPGKRGADTVGINVPHQQRQAVGRFSDHANRQHARNTGTIFDDDLLAPHSGELGGEHACQRVSATAGPEADDDPYVATGPRGLRKQRTAANCQNATVLVDGHSAFLLSTIFMRQP